MQFPQPFDARAVEPSFGISLVPAGDYPVYIESSESKATKEGDGGMLVLWLVVMPQHPNKGHKFMWNLNLFNKNQQTVEIAYKQLSGLCHVLQVFNLQASEQLHNIPFIATVNNDGTYNNVKAVKDINGNLPGKGAQAPQAGPPQPPAATAYAPPAAAPAWGAQPQAPPAAPPAPATAPSWGPPAPGAPTYAPPQAAPPTAAAPWGALAPAAAPPTAPPAGAAPPWGPPAAPTWTPPK